jgi:hypothetical protein
LPSEIEKQAVISRRKEVPQRSRTAASNVEEIPLRLTKKSSAAPSRSWRQNAPPPLIVALSYQQ